MPLAGSNSTLLPVPPLLIQFLSDGTSVRIYFNDGIYHWPTLIQFLDTGQVIINQLERGQLSRRLWNVSEQFLLAATAQNLKRLVRFLAQQPPKVQLQVN